MRVGGRTDRQTEITKLSLLQFCERAYKGLELRRAVVTRPMWRQRHISSIDHHFWCTLYVSHTMQTTLRVSPHPLLQDSPLHYPTFLPVQLHIVSNITPLQDANEPAEICAICSWNSLKSKQFKTSAIALSVSLCGRRITLTEDIYQ